MAKRRRTKGLGQVVKSGRVWGIKYTEGGTRKYKGGFLTRDQADQEALRIAGNVSAGKPAVQAPPGGRKQIRDLVSKWLDDRAGMRSIADDRNRWKRHLADVVETRAIGAVDAALVQTIKSQLLAGSPARVGSAVRPAAAEKAPLDPATVERVLYTLSSFYRWAIRAGHAEANPVKAYLASLNPAERRQLRSQHDPESTPYLERAEDVARVVRALARPMCYAYALTAAAGLRPGEALALEWEDVDTDRSTIRVHRQIRHGRLGPTKSGKPRTVPMTAGLRALLVDWRARCASRLVVPPLRLRKNRNAADGRAHMGAVTVQNAITKALASEKLPAMSWYAAGRHTFASQWVLAGLDIYRLSQIMGHASVVTTQRYAHLTAKTPPEMMDRVSVGLL